MQGQRRRTAFALLGSAAALLAAAVTDGSASTAIRPAPGAPDPAAMVLTSEDLGRARVTLQRYFKDPDFPSVISYEREFEDGRHAGVALPYADSLAEIGVSAATTRRFLGLIRRFLGTRESRKLIRESFEEEVGDLGLVTHVRVGRPRALGAGEGSFDLLVTARILGIRMDFHTAYFRVERALGVVSAIGEPGRRVPLSVMTRLARIMTARMAVELAPENTALPVISGTPTVGQELTATTGTWLRKPTSFGYRWERCDAAGAGCATVSGATGRTYVVDYADLGSTLRVVVTARNAAGSATATSAPTGVVSGFVDTFSGDGPSPFWTATAAGAGPTIVQANGQLELTLPASTSLGAGGFASASVLMRCRFPGDFDIQVDYRLLSGLLPIDRINVTFEVAEFTGATWTSQHGVFVHNAGGTTHGISTHFPHPGVFGPPYNDFVPDSSSSGTLRLVRTTAAGATRITASRLHGTSWSFTSLAYAAPTSQAAYLSVWTDVAPLPGTIRVAFDDFRITSGAVTCP